MTTFLSGLYLILFPAAMILSGANESDSVLVQRQIEELEKNQALVSSIRNLRLYEQQVQLEVRLAQLQLQYAQTKSQLRGLQEENTKPKDDTLASLLTTMRLVAVIDMSERRFARFQTPQGIVTFADNSEIAPGVTVKVEHTWVELRDQHSFYRFYLE
ncbi:MAG: hypothetical protein LAT77_05880 [Aliidiomarina sp.]|uniref:hypothetical protein n=1 Tax=Aliidiomarina sp. TaxID=1872439 RepID=UPI0025C4749A|nr:hypothetical protein [Aliidiomarina sp.]MCH8501428.1 hypothetical protein [Aliidiomarina sp.]